MEGAMAPRAVDHRCSHRLGKLDGRSAMRAGTTGQFGAIPIVGSDGGKVAGPRGVDGYHKTQQHLQRTSSVDLYLWNATMMGGGAALVTVKRIRL